MERWRTKQIRRSVYLLLIIGSLALMTSCKYLILAKGYPEYKGEFRGLPLKQPVTVLRDKNGIPHIYARDKHDLMVAQGFVHAQDRLWQMEALRRVSTGRLSEFAGEGRLKLDYFARLLGLPELRRNAAQALSPDELSLLQSYVDGVNAYIRLRGEDLPLEFLSANHTPEDWTVEDLFSFFTLNSWMFRENYRPELMVLQARQSVELHEWKDIYPSHRNANLPDDAYFESLRSLKIGSLHEAALSFFQALPEQASGGGSNLWAVAEGPGGKPLLANDTHIGVSVPGTWYLCHLNAPGVDITGASAPGVPGVMIGHTDSVAWGLAVLPTDFVDLFVVRVDPQHPTRYIVGEQILEMEKEQILIKLPEGESRRMTVFHTIYGPVITELEKGVEGAVALRWYGTLPDGELSDRTMRTVLGFMDSHSVDDIMDSIRHTKIVGLTFVAADTDGNIGWHTTGAIPIRNGYSGRLPADGSSGVMNWNGFLPYEEMPGVVNPESGSIINSNNRVVTDSDPHPISNTFSAPYRVERIASMLSELNNPTKEDFRRMQMDVYSLQAEELLPKLFVYSFQDEKAVAAVEILKSWDRQVRADSSGAAVYEVFLNQWVRTLLEDEVGEYLYIYFHTAFKKYLIQDVILDRPNSTLWDRKDTPEKEGPQRILEMALSKTFSWLEEELGSNPRRWSWGRLHTNYWKHAGGNNWFTAMLLNSGPYPADGDCTTVNANTYNAAKDEYKAISIAALRMVIPLDDLDGMQIIAPMGQSGQPGHKHYDDMIKGWLKGELVHLPSSRGQVEAAAVSEMTLSP